MIRPFRQPDRPRLLDITAEVFAPAAIDRRLQDRFGLVAGRDWLWRKLRQIDDDLRANPSGVFVFERDAQILGFVTTTLDPDAAIGRIPNLAVSASAQRRGVARSLLLHALDYLKLQGMELAKIETLVGNAAGETLYPSLGFVEIARQIHFFKEL